jgi:hypothetical protein
MLTCAVDEVYELFDALATVTGGSATVTFRQLYILAGSCSGVYIMQTDLGEVAAGVLHADDRTHIADAVDHRLERQLLQLLLSCFMTCVLLCKHHAHVLQVRLPCWSAQLRLL